jgi:hypothetical protein
MPTQAKEREKEENISRSSLNEEERAKIGRGENTAQQFRAPIEQSHRSIIIVNLCQSRLLS